MLQRPACCKNGSKSRADLNKVTDFLKLINEPNRLKILCLLRDTEQCVCDIWKTLEIAQNLTSHHLKALKDSGLIFSRQEGRKIIYRSDKKTIRKYSSLLNNFLISNL
jgi:DNA-binding transcriptional ArsR family regulator